MTPSVAYCVRVSEALFREAFEQLGLAAGKAATLPDHRDRPHEALTVETQSPGGEVSLQISEGKVEGLRLDRSWFEHEEVDVAAALIQNTINDAYQQWAQQELDQVTTRTPDMKELYGALGAARAKLGEAWVQGLAEVRS